MTDTYDATELFLPVGDAFKQAVLRNKRLRSIARIQGDPRTLSCMTQLNQYDAIMYVKLKC